MSAHLQFFSDILQELFEQTYTDETSWSFHAKHLLWFDSCYCCWKFTVAERWQEAWLGQPV